MGVPILRIPVVALKVLLDYFSNVELVTVGLLSKRADWFLRACGKKNVSFSNLKESEIKDLHVFNKLELFLLESRRHGELPEWNFRLYCSVGNGLFISISCIHFNIHIYFKTLENNEEFVRVRRNLKVGNSFVPVVITREKDLYERVYTFWNDKAYGMIAFMDYLKSCCNSPITELFIDGNNSSVIRTVVNHINSTETLVKRISVCFNPKLSDDDFKAILTNVSATESFTSHFNVGQNFEYDGKILAKEIQISSGHWFTLQNLLRSDETEDICVEGSNYTKEELQMFLKDWKSGKFPKLKEVMLATNVSPMDVIAGYEIWEGECGGCGFWVGPVIKIKGHGDCHGDVHTDYRGYYYMSIHDN